MGVVLAIVTKAFCYVFKFVVFLFVFSDHTYHVMQRSKMSLSSTFTSLPPLLSFQICSDCRLKNGDSVSWAKLI